MIKTFRIKYILPKDGQGKKTILFGVVFRINYIVTVLFLCTNCIYYFNSVPSLQEIIQRKVETNKIFVIYENM